MRQQHERDPSTIAFGSARSPWALLCLLVLSVPATSAEPGPRTLVLALDGVPFRVLERARQGLCEGA